MTNLISAAGGRKFVLTVSTMIAGTAIAPFFPAGILEPVLVFLASCLAAFVTSNWASSREYHKTKMQVEGSAHPQVKQLIAETKKLHKKLDDAMKTGNNEDIANEAFEQFRQLNETVLTVGQTAGTTLQAVQNLNNKVSNIISLKG